MDFDLRQLEAFIQIVDQGGFSAASRSMHLSQAAVSERIANLESGIGMRLLDRRPREVRMTAAGKHLYERANQLLEHRRSIYLELEELAGVVRGSLLIGASNIPGEYVLPQLLADFYETYPQVQLNISINNSDSIIEQVRHGDLDLGVVGAEPADERLLCEWLWEDELLLVVPAGHRLANKKRIKAEELVNEAFVSREPGSGTRQLMEARYAEQGLDAPVINIAVGSTTAVKEAVRSGLGISIISARAVQSEIKSGDLIAVDIQGMHFDRQFLLVTDPGKTASPLCTRFTQYLKQTLQYNNQIPAPGR